MDQSIPSNFEVLEKVHKSKEDSIFSYVKYTMHATDQ